MKVIELQSKTLTNQDMKLLLTPQAEKTLHFTLKKYLNPLPLDYSKFADLM
jgi:hypothetical protein